jgi:hypothetical protein
MYTDNQTQDNNQTPPPTLMERMRKYMNGEETGVVSILVIIVLLVVAVVVIYFALVHFKKIKPFNYGALTLNTTPSGATTVSPTSSA